AWKMGEHISGRPLREIYWEGEEKDMADTASLQPALFIVDTVTWLYLRSKIDTVSAAAGHSLGEYCALCAAGVLDFKHCLEIVCLRGRLMADAGIGQNGSMAAILKLNEDQVRDLVQEVHEETGREILIANYNTPRQLVVSGDDMAVDAATKKAMDKKGRSVILPVSGAFHTPMMQEAADELAGYMDKKDWNPPEFPVFFNATAGPEPDPEKIRKIMHKQMVSSVYWNQLVQNMHEYGVHTFLELGPRGVLSRMVGQILGTDGEFETKCIESLEDMDSF
ncbi:MAG: ACP S-malonyltransferase, partial [Desulfonatronovibrionaceae bacterium]